MPRPDGLIELDLPAAAREIGEQSRRPARGARAPPRCAPGRAAPGGRAGVRASPPRSRSLRSVAQVCSRRACSAVNLARQALDPLLQRRCKARRRTSCSRIACSRPSSASRPKLHGLGGASVASSEPGTVDNDDHQPAAAAEARRASLSLIVTPRGMRVRSRSRRKCCCLAGILWPESTAITVSPAVLQRATACARTADF